LEHKNHEVFNHIISTYLYIAYAQLFILLRLFKYQTLNVKVQLSR